MLVTFSGQLSFRSASAAKTPTPSSVSRLLPIPSTSSRGMCAPSSCVLPVVAFPAATWQACGRRSGVTEKGPEGPLRSKVRIRLEFDYGNLTGLCVQHVHGAAQSRVKRAYEPRDVHR